MTKDNTGRDFRQLSGVSSHCAFCSKVVSFYRLCQRLNISADSVADAYNTHDL